MDSEEERLSVDEVAQDASPVASEAVITALEQFIRNAVQVLLLNTKSTSNDATRIDVSRATLETFASSAAPEVVFAQRMPNSTVLLAGLLNDQNYGSLAFIKISGLFVTSTSIQDQLQVVRLPGVAQQGNDTPNNTSLAYQSLHSLVKLALAPYFDAFSRSSLHADDQQMKGDIQSTAMHRDASSFGIPVTQRKIAELETSLMQLQQNIEIPLISLTLHPQVQAALDHASQTGEKPRVDFLSTERLEDAAFMNELQATTNTWIREIQRLTAISHDVESGPISHEISFWSNLEAVLDDVERQLQSDGVQLTLAILKQGKRFLVSASFTSDTGLKQARERVQSYNAVLKELPLNQLLSATSIAEFPKILTNLFNNLNRRLRSSSYPVQRALGLTQALSADLHKKLLDLINGRELMFIDSQAFQLAISACEETFATWDEQMKQFTNLSRDLTRRRGEKFINMRIIPQHAALRERLEYLQSFRKSHEQLLHSLEKVYPSTAHNSNVTSSFNPAMELKEAYRGCRDINVLDLNAGETYLWVTAEIAYKDAVERIEQRVLEELRDLLAHSSTSAEMFRTFARFNALFSQPRVRGAVADYQKQYIVTVKRDIATLRRKYLERYSQSHSYGISKLRDYAPLSGAVQWARQIERQLNRYLTRVGNVLGEDWQEHPEGQILEPEITALRQALSQRNVVDSWIKDVTGTNLNFNGKILHIVRNPGSKGFELSMRLDSQAITLFKEVRNLNNLIQHVPISLSNLSRDSKKLYPFAVAIVENLRIYSRVVDQLHHLPDLWPLMHKYIHEAQEVIRSGISLEWEYFLHISEPLHNVLALQKQTANNPHALFLKSLILNVSKLETKFSFAVDAHEQITDLITHLSKTPKFRHEAKAILSQIQEQVSNLSLEKYSNMSEWLLTVNSRIADILKSNLHRYLLVWVEKNELTSEATELFELPSSTEDLEFIPRLQFSHSLVTRSQAIHLLPPLEQAKSGLIESLNSIIGEITTLPKIRLSQGRDVGNALPADNYEYTFDELVSRIAETHLIRILGWIEDLVLEGSNLAARWTSFESLWDLDQKKIENEVGGSLSRWMQLLGEMRSSRTILETDDFETILGPIRISFGSVQNRALTKYEIWQRQALETFSATLGEVLRNLHQKLAFIRSILDIKLDSSDIASVSIEEAVNFMTALNEHNLSANKWEKEIELCSDGQAMLLRDRFHLANSWIYAEQVRNEARTLKEIAERKQLFVDNNLGICL